MKINSSSGVLEEVIIPLSIIYSLLVTDTHFVYRQYYDPAIFIQPIGSLNVRVIDVGASVTQVELLAEDIYVLSNWYYLSSVNVSSQEIIWQYSTNTFLI